MNNDEFGQRFWTAVFFLACLGAAYRASGDDLFVVAAVAAGFACIQGMIDLAVRQLRKK